MKSQLQARVAVSIAGVVFVLGMAARSASASVVLEYKFDEGSGVTAADSSGNNNNGSLAQGGGANYTTTAKQGPFAISLVPTGNGLSYVQPASNPLAGVTSFTIDAWIDPNAGGTDRRSIFSNTPGTGTGPGFNFYLNNSGTTDHALVFATNGAVLSSGSIGAFGVYHNVAVTVSSAGSNPTVALYVDGQPATTSGTVANVTDLTTLPRIGVFTDNDFNSNFFGNVDDVRVFNTALTATQVAALVPEPGAAASLAVAGVALVLRRGRNSKLVKERSRCAREIT